MARLGAPIEGHLTIASFGWWTRQFEAAGFVRDADIERRIHPHLARFGLTKYWNLYVLRVPDVPPATGDHRSASEIADVEKRFGLAIAEGIGPDHITLGDVDSPEALERYQTAKRERKARMRADPR